MPPPTPFAPWQLAQFALKIAAPAAGSPTLATVCIDEPAAAAAAGVAALIAPLDAAPPAGAAAALGDAESLAVDESDDFEQPVATSRASTALATNTGEMTLMCAAFALLATLTQ